MTFDAVKRDAPIDHEHSADYWRERAECLEEWVCELLRKNQALRMDLERERSQHPHLQEATLAPSIFHHYQSPSLLVGPVFGAEWLKVDSEAVPAPCPRSGCTEVRKSVIRYVVANDSVIRPSN
jgi:hypothetical protein